MPIITISFEHPEVKAPQYKFGDRLVVKDDNSPREWLVGEVVGLTLETESYSPRWWYSIKLDAPHGLTEEYLEDDVIPVTEIALLQTECLQQEAKPMPESNHNHSPLPKFQPGMRVKLNAASGFSNLVRDFAVVVSSNYVSNDSWSGWTYLLHNENLSQPIEIGEIWLELVPSTTSAKP